MFLTGDNEQRFVQRLKDGNRDAAQELYTRYGPILAGVCSRYIADEEDIKDVFQNAFLSILTHISDFHYRADGSLMAWAKKVVVNESLKFLKKNRPHELLECADDVADDDTDSADPVFSDIPPDIIQEMLSQLPTGYRTVLNLYVFEDMSHQEIAQLLGISRNGSASQLHRAKKMLKRMIRMYNETNSR